MTGEIRSNCKKGDRVRIGDIARITSGKRPVIFSERPEEDARIPIYGGAGITGYTKKPLFKESVIVTGRVGTLGLLHKVKHPSWPSDNTLVIIPKDGEALYDFIYYNLKLKVQKLISLNRGTSNPLIVQRDVKNLEITLPSLSEQRRIASILGAIDDKIELNHEMNRTLEEMAQAIFRSWFVDFEPFKDGEFEYSEELDKEIPKGWDVVQISDIAKVTSGKRPSIVQGNQSQDSPVPVYGGSGIMGYTSEPLFIVPILVTGRVGTLGKLYRANPPSWPSDNTLVVIVKDKFYFEFVYFFLQRIKLESLNRGTSNPLITQGDIKRQKVALPPTNIISNFSSTCHTLFEQCRINDYENSTLAKIRDSLLPKLMSGEIRVNVPETEMSA
ncbi:MAG: restriction endonuclease subunit S [Methanosarcinales archaeon]|nr:MAG: restriction endonuclease subunit S [Methanosarcinales archaeon]